MIIIWVFFTLIVAISTFENWHPLSEKYIEKINKKSKTWLAGKNFEVDEYEKVKRLCSGSLMGGPTPDYVVVNPHNEEEGVPETFDAREQWPKCESIKEIRDQGSCGSCWAFGAVESMSDRICIHSNQTKQTRISAEDLNNCCNYCSFGCGAGGFPLLAWDYWTAPGIVTGGKYQSNQGCQDYTFQPCSHHMNGTFVNCSTLPMQVATPDCVKKCNSAAQLNYEFDLTVGQNYSKFTNEKQIMLEVYKNGPIEVSFRVMDDFPSYRSGVYQPTSTSEIGGHAVKILGWGVENNLKYWLIANSWNEEWGDKGFFKMIRGVNSGKIESEGYAAKPML